MQTGSFSNAASLGAGSVSEKKKELLTFAEFILLDIKRREIVFHQTMGEKRTVWGENDYTWTGILTPEQWKKEWERKQSERKLDQNAQAILKKISKQLADYLENRR